MEFRILRSFKTKYLDSIPVAFGEKPKMVKEAASEVLQYRHDIDCDWQDVPIVDFDEDTGEYI